MAAAEFDFADVKEKAEKALRAVFPTDTIDVTESYKGRAHVLIVSATFNGMSERQKQDFIWDVLRAEMESDADAVTSVVCYGTEELM